MDCRTESELVRFDWISSARFGVIINSEGIDIMSTGAPAIMLHPIGRIFTPFDTAAGTPIQPAVANGVHGTVEVFPEYSAGLADIDGFSHLFLLFHFNRCTNIRLQVVPYLDTTERGVFSTRAPCRPNGIGISVVRLVEREGNRLKVQDVDMLNGTPLLDIKPYIAAFDSRTGTRSGWLDSVGDSDISRADDRFHSHES
jgi:tRNA (adenine37-N6)-methyltransferase